MPGVGLDRRIVDALLFEPGEQGVAELVGEDGACQPGRLRVALSSMRRTPRSM